MMPSTTSGVVCQAPATACYIHDSSRFFALAVVICVSSL
jgi:hypothetical protein